MKRNYSVDVEDFGKVTLSRNADGTYECLDESGNSMGVLDPDDYEDWTDDEFILSSIVSEAIDEGTLEPIEIEERDDY